MRKNTKVERFIDIKHNGIAKKNLQKVFFGICFAKNRSPGLFFLCVKLLNSLPNIEFFQLGENFSLRGYGAKFWAGVPHQLFNADSKNPSRLLQAMKSLPQVFFWSGATGQAFWRRTISQAMFCPGLRGKIFVRGYGARFLAGKNCASDEKVFSGIFFTKTRTPGPHFLFM